MIDCDGVREQFGDKLRLVAMIETEYMYNVRPFVELLNESNDVNYRVSRLGALSCYCS